MLQAGRVVFATHGRDKGSLYLVVGSVGDRVLIADGRRRKLQRPKAKNPAHLTATAYSIPTERVTGNDRLRRLLGEHSQRQEAKQKVN